MAILRKLVRSLRRPRSPASPPPPPRRSPPSPLTPLQQDVVREYQARRKTRSAIRDYYQSLIPDPYVVRRQLCGVRFDLLIGNTTSVWWYDKPDTAGADGVQREEALELDFIRDQGLVRAGDVVFDVGAHQGVYSLCLASWVGPSGHVYAFEPFPQNADLVAANARLNGVSNLTVVPAAVGEHTGKVRVVQEMAMVAGEGVPGSESLEVDSLRLDDLADKRPAFVKIDVEGYEAFVLRGARKLLSSAPNLLLEVHGPFLRQRGGSIAEVLTLVDWGRYDCWYNDAHEPTVFKPWNPGIPLREDVNSWLFARRK